MSPEKSSNKASLVVAIFFIFLILGGVYILNQSFSRPPEDTTSSQVATPRPASETPSTNTNNNSTSQPESNDNQEADPEPSDSIVTNPTTTGTTSRPSTGTGNDLPDGDSPTEEGSTNTPPTTNSNTPTPNSEEKPEEETDNSKPSEQRLTATLLEIRSNNETRWIIRECSIPNAKLCKPGASLRLIGAREYASLTRGNTYVITADMAETDREIVINLIRSIRPQ